MSGPGANQFNTTEMLTTEAAVQYEIGIVKTPTAIDPYIAWVSQWILRRVGVYSLSTLFSVTETTNGTGTARLKLKQPPVNSVTSVQVGSQILVPSTVLTMPGYFLEDNQNFIAFRSCGAGWWSPNWLNSRFPRGIGNVQVIYQSGYDGAPADVFGIATRITGLMVKRKDTINEKQLALPSGGSSVWLNDVELTKDVEAVIRLHSRVSF